MARRRATVLAELDGVQVCSDPDNPDGRLLLIDGIDASYVDLDDPTYLDFGYVRRIGDVADAGWPQGQPIAAVHLGGAGASLPRYIRATRPGSRQVIFEVDQRVLSVAREHLGLRSGKGMRVRHEDGRVGLARIPDASQDLVVGDAFEGTRVPATLGSVEAAYQISRTLRPGGLYALNIIDSPPLVYARSQVSTLTRVFEYVGLTADPGVLRGRRTGNVVLLAGHQPLPVAELADRARRAALPERVLDTRACQRFAAGAPVLRDSGSGSPGALPGFR